MDELDLVQCQESWFLHKSSLDGIGRIGLPLLREFLQHFPVSAVDLGQRVLEPLASLISRLDRPDRDGLSVSLKAQRGVRLDVEQLHDGPVDDESVAVAVFGEILDHGVSLRYNGVFPLYIR